MLKTKNQFLNLLKVIEKNNGKEFKWELPDHSKNFGSNLIESMEECLTTDINCPKDAKDWIYTILNGYEYKKDITNQVQPNLMTNSVWQYIRRWLFPDQYIHWEEILVFYRAQWKKKWFLG